MDILTETPIHPLRMEGNYFYIKRDDLLPFSLGGNKVRIAHAFLADMRAKGGNFMILYGNSRSNLCRVLANACHIEGIPCLMICSEDSEGGSALTGNSRLVGWLGAEVLRCPKDQIAPAVDRAFETAKSRGFVPYYIYGNRLGEGNEGTAARAYADAYAEICRQEEQMGVHFDYIFHASGTGATQSGLICGHLLAHDRRHIVGISVSRDKERGTRILRTGVESYFADRALHLPEGFDQEIELTDAYLAGGYGKYDGTILSVIRRQFCENGICLDPTYTGKAFRGMCSYLDEHDIRGKQILFLHTGGTPLFFDALSLESDIR